MPRLGEYKIHKCCICKKTLPYKPHRLVHQEWNDKYQYQNIFNYDFCNNCFKTFERWLEKHNAR